MAGRDWEREGACAQIGGDLWHSRDHEDREAAAWICRTRCAVREACLEYALDNREAHGIWGGLNTRQRLLLEEQRAREAVAARG